jgi:uracil phosphoribosyltransferase
LFRHIPVYIVKHLRAGSCIVVLLLRLFATMKSGYVNLLLAFHQDKLMYLVCSVLEITFTRLRCAVASMSEFNQKTSLIRDASPW